MKNSIFTYLLVNSGTPQLSIPMEMPREKLWTTREDRPEL